MELMEFTLFVEKYNLPVDDVHTHTLYISHLKAGKVKDMPKTEPKEKDLPLPKPAVSNSPFPANMNLF